MTDRTGRPVEEGHGIARPYTQGAGRATLPLSLAALVALWVLAARLTADPEILPGPAEVLGVAWAELRAGELLYHVAWTLWRVIAGFTLAMLGGIAIGFALGRSDVADAWFGPWVIVALNVPALVVIVLCYLWIGLNDVAAITAVAFNKTAMVAVNIREGVRALDPRLADMAQVFRMDRLARLRHVTLPQLWPFLSASTRNGLAIIWKIVLVVEFLGRSNGVGFQIHLYFQLFEVGYVLAYALAFVAVMLVIDVALLQPWERRTTRWRRASGSR